MVDKTMTFTAKEISVATGQDMGKITSRYKARVGRGELPDGLKAFTYDQVKIILSTRKRGEPDPRKVDLLRTQLQTDGFAIAKRTTGGGE